MCGPKPSYKAPPPPPPPEPPPAPMTSPETGRNSADTGQASLNANRKGRNSMKIDLAAGDSSSSLSIPG